MLLQGVADGIAVNEGCIPAQHQGVSRLFLLHKGDRLHHRMAGTQPFLLQYGFVSAVQVGIDLRRLKALHHANPGQSCPFACFDDPLQHGLLQYGKHGLGHIRLHALALPPCENNHVVHNNLHPQHCCL